MKPMKQLKKILFAGVLVLILLLAVFSRPSVKAEEGGVTELWTYEDLLKIAEEPGGSYRLMTDIDLKGRSWTPVDFSGTFDGNGCALLNVSVTSPGATLHTTLDGNRITYDTSCAGFFSALINASVTNLKILGIDISLNTSSPTFIGGIAGFMEKSRISGCTVSGTETLYTSGKSFGVGGIAGFGDGKIENTKADMTLVCVDTDRENKDEQFMGGAYAAGFIDLDNDTILIDGYDSDHGYVHNGGLVGMYILYPEDSDYYGSIMGDTVTGQITFFEDNEDRRAYCEAYIGEIMNWTFAYDEDFSADSFTRNEVFEYDTDLLPHNCTSPSYDQTVVEPTETENGYTLHRCTQCGYTYAADYTPRVGIAVSEPETEEESASLEEQTEASAAASEKQAPTVLIVLIIVLVIVIIILLILLITNARSLRRRGRKRR